MQAASCIGTMPSERGTAPATAVDTRLTDGDLPDHQRKTWNPYMRGAELVTTGRKSHRRLGQYFLELALKLIQIHRLNQVGSKARRTRPLSIVFVSPAGDSYESRFSLDGKLQDVMR